MSARLKSPTILVFVGAGGSAAVDPEQYPTTEGFFKRLEEDVTENGLFQRIVEFIESKKEEGASVDIEEVLGALQEVQEYCRVLENPETLVGWVMEREFLQEFYGQMETNRLLDSLASFNNEHIASLISEINEQVYDVYSPYPSDPEKVSVWVQLLQGLAEVGLITELFTTNYDRVLDYVVELAEVRISPGFRSRLDQRELNLSFWRNSTEDFGLLTKLHGAVNWHREDQTIITGPCKYTGSDEDHSILYPAHKGTPTEEPFITFHNHLQNVVQQEDLTAALFIGFAFRDDYINSILKYLPRTTKTFFFTFVGEEEPPDATPPDRAPRVEECVHFRNGLREENVRMCLEALRDLSGASPT